MESCASRGAGAGRYNVARLMEKYGDMKLPELRHVLANCPKAKSYNFRDQVQGQVRRGQPAVMCRAARSGSHLGRRRLSPVRQFCRFCRTQPSHLNLLDRRCATPPAPRSLIGRTQSP